MAILGKLLWCLSIWTTQKQWEKTAPLDRAGLLDDARLGQYYLTSALTLLSHPHF